MWGLPSVTERSRAVERFIPTHVGFTSSFAVPFNHLPVHPHTCGVYCYEFSFRLDDDGSSPHMWGLRARTQQTAKHHAVHPHTCGVYIFLCYLFGTFPGSSPHMWGLPGQSIDSGKRVRFIPTHVGFTLESS